jgi:hypothetical protein
MVINMGFKVIHMAVPTPIYEFIKSNVESGLETDKETVEEWAAEVVQGMVESMAQDITTGDYDDDPPPASVKIRAIDVVRDILKREEAELLGITEATETKAKLAARDASNPDKQGGS